MSYAPPKPAAKAFDQHKRLLVIQVAAALAVMLLLFTKPFLVEGSDGHEYIEALGIGFVLVCFLGRLWSILYVGGRKNDELVTIGPFSMSRNPLYFFSTVGAAGVGLMYGSVLVAAALALVSYLVFRVTARKEAEFLFGKFGPAYSVYAERTPPFWPNPLLFHDQAERRFSTKALRRTFTDGLYFLALFPAIETIEQLRISGMLPVFFTLY
ncbi:isoprenylcysteine carboxylmethyltransferase family protein [Mesorhizobium sp. M0761]|uniref:methyltransferase family protein n=3 Tax=Mesorhizobium TaxID=68287 RepID=UPI0003CEF905|nr:MULTISPECIES: isoprenylcysteine carboxylmethyltransferase family protein [unclassified Mesorhizobium]ESW64364.1 sodium:proton antiporter [Mesorhizobium sp. LSJC277A00]ESX13216.1 sodium:proton antiporter [Mesorhizobium sp. LSJC255A00]ESX23101.1 sodium:proton antiporter [Mesorhizobium sp. LSHC440B00]ESX30836.1 sodium:proton antiporter [Mesorhizobium sp. LSHC432A00]ESX34608.1 sodium:proton antiporter [Mesorhizobium sp. LSHC440A00]